MNLDVRKLWLIRKTITEMLEDRGYDTKEIKTTESEFISKFKNNLDLSLMKIIIEKDNISLMVLISDEIKISLKGIKLIFDEMQRMNIKKLILIADGIGHSAQKLIDESEYEIDFFKTKELMFNVTQHVLVPKHRILTLEEKNEFLKNRKLKENELPQIMKNDPVAKYYGARKGDVFEIQRISETAGISLYYRIVV